MFIRLKQLAKLLTPPIFLPLLKAIYNVANLQSKKNSEEEVAVLQHEKQASPADTGLTERACHYFELFIRHNGDVYPCCRVWGNEKMKIGHIDDFNLTDKIKDFYSSCECGEYKLGRANSEDRPNYQLLNIELSLTCQGKCAMCCVNAPDWTGSYNYFDSLMQLLEFCRSKELLLQGGEVLIQKKSLDWVLSVRQRFGDDIRIALVTNGNVNLDMAETVSKLFNRVTISFVGFQAETYTTIMGMDIEKAKSFAEMLSKKRNVALYLKFLITPINMHEANLFLDWAVPLASQKIEFVQASLSGYINKNTEDKYWDKIFSRASSTLKNSWIRNKSILENNNTHVVFFEDTLRLYNIDAEFIEKNKLQKTFHLNLR